LTIENIPVC